MTYERLLSYGNIIQLKFNCDINKLKDEISQFEFSQYNPDKDINRFGLSVTSIDGKLNGIDLDTLKGKPYDELDFNQVTKVYYMSKEVRKFVDPFLPYLGRTHFLNIKKGGYFPPHRDELSLDQHSFRIIVPISKFNPPNHYMIYDDKILHLNEGYEYFMNTNVFHSSFSFSDNTLMLVLNIKACQESYKILLKNINNV